MSSSNQSTMEETITKPVDEKHPIDHEDTNLEPSEPPSSLRDSCVRFFVLYFTTLFSLDTITAAANSPFSQPDHDSSARATIRAARRVDWGEGARVGMRLDPGGPARRNGGIRGGGNIDVPTCAACAIPRVS
ncbi:hypothetical protein BT63DRAFT_34342 [Microthyrium microscopicum]|uniref:Uncharacterized protein n=1 Tax=Microthyrium microscopicum TaxID=703497 RepID=A0A6A6UU71_9PEZI|nr:hypothetical protein BT63DRAFT_34342 [Microthyrium microscopicum]